MRLVPVLLAAVVLSAGCAVPPQAPSGDWPRHTLRADRVRVVDTPGDRRVDTSALLVVGPGRLLTVNNLRPEFFVIDAGTAGTDPLPLQPAPGVFTRAQLDSLAGQRRYPYDFEGLARDEAGRFYVCDEAQRWVLRLDAGSNRVERLEIDWEPAEKWFSDSERNASFEGIAVGRDRLYVANERSAPVLITVDLRTMRVVETFQARPHKASLLGLHYSDLCWFEDRLWVLCRQHQVVLEVNPETHAILAEYDYEAVEDALGYRKTLPAGIMEGLAVDRDAIWLLTDNNGWARRDSATDLRPTLVRCPRPARP